MSILKQWWTTFDHTQRLPKVLRQLPLKYGNWKKYFESKKHIVWKSNRRNRLWKRYKLIIDQKPIYEQERGNIHYIRVDEWGWIPAGQF